MALAILLPIAATQVHDSILRIATVFAIGLVFTTRAFKRITSHTTIRLRCKQECYGIPRPKLRKECVQKIFTRCKAAEDELTGDRLRPSIWTKNVDGKGPIGLSIKGRLRQTRPT